MSYEYESNGQIDALVTPEVARKLLSEAAEDAFKSADSHSLEHNQLIGGTVAAMFEQLDLKEEFFAKQTDSAQDPEITAPISISHMLRPLYTQIEQIKRCDYAADNHHLTKEELEEMIVDDERIIALDAIGTSISLAYIAMQAEDSI